VADEVFRRPARFGRLYTRGHRGANDAELLGAVDAPGDRRTRVAAEDPARAYAFGAVELALEAVLARAASDRFARSDLQRLAGGARDVRFDPGREILHVNPYTTPELCYVRVGVSTLKVGVLGAGSIGCFVGGALAAIGGDVVLVGRARTKA